MFCDHPSLYDPAIIEPIQPRALRITEWSQRDYRSVYAWRLKQIEVLERDPFALAAAKAYYSKPEH